MLVHYGCVDQEMLTGVALLRALHPDEGDEFSLDVYLSRAEGAVERGTGDTVR